MSDYHTYISLLRGELVEMLSSNEEQLLYVLTETLSKVAVDSAIEAGQLSPESNPELVVFNLRKIADAIESGDVSGW